MQYRNYDPEKDKKAANRIWLECGWIEKDDSKPMDTLIEKARTIVADVNGEPECLVVSTLGNMDYLGERIPFSCIAGVTTSLIARKQRLAARLTATRIALDTLDGCHVSGLGTFEQGYYDKLGYGSETYHHYAMFSPAILSVDVEPRVPTRLDIDDFEKLHKCRLNRLRMHGSVSIDLPEVTKAEMQWSKAGFGFGYFDDSGKLTHHLWMKGKGKEQGPYEVWWMAYQNFDQFKELLALLKSFGDQIHLVKMVEPPGVHVQDFLKQPFRFRDVTRKSEFENTTRAAAWHQRRICDLEKCLEKTHLSGEDVRFNLKLHDPIEKYLDDDIGWKGISGDYVVTLGPDSNAEKGSDDSLPTLTASVGAFTRMWLGVLPASSLTIGDNLTGPQELIEKLDHLIRVPRPAPHWEY
jgi:hypothetical protein